MKTLPVALQVYSVRDYAEKDFANTMKRIKQIGYEGVELGGLYGNSPEFIKNALADAGLAAASAHVPLSDFADDLTKTVNDYKTIGCRYVAIPYLPAEMRPKNCDFNEVVEEFKKIGRACADAGIELLYHNHVFEFEKIGETYLLDYIYENIPAEILKAQPDTCWIRVAGVDPVGYVKKYSGRCPVVHLKDFTGGKAEGMYELIGDDKTKAEAGEKFQFKPLGAGVQDMPAILAAAVGAGAEWVVVEQDGSLDLDMFDAVKQSREYLRTLGW